MNQAQRKYLIDKIQTNTTNAIKVLRESMPKEPLLKYYCAQALNNGTLQLKSLEEIMAVLNRRVLDHGDFSIDGYRFSASNTSISFTYDEIFILPEDYKIAHAEWKTKTQAINETITTLQSQTDGLCTRIQLASDKTLDKMIAEVDDMGDLSFMDCTLKALMTKSETNLLK